MSLVSIGVPVYNGEAMLERALESLLAQTWDDLEIILCDNASTDRTAEICRAFVARDPRVSFHPSDVNRGASWNFTRAFELSGGGYFKWAAHDDVCDPRFVEACMEAFAGDSQVVLAHSASEEVGLDGAFIRRLNLPSMGRAKSAVARFGSVVLEWHASLPIFGIIRSDVLRKTPVMGKYVGSDWILLAELALYGSFAEIPEVLFWRTEHGHTSQNAFDIWERLEWFDSSKSGTINFPHWRMVSELTKAIGRAEPLSRTERRHCMATVARYVFSRPRGLWRDCAEATKAGLRRSRAGARLVESLKRSRHGPSGRTRAGGLER